MWHDEHIQEREMAALASNAQTKGRACFWEVFISPLLDMGVWSKVEKE
jgi:hypothetical protein